jgi:small glutamine-rich tetratricopeptide repeat-containing protein alpha
LKKYQESVQAYSDALVLDPKNTSIESSLKTAKQRLESEIGSSSPSGPSGSGPNMDFGSFLNDPNMMNMAKNLMNSGALGDLLKNPNIAQM